MTEIVLIMFVIYTAIQIALIVVSDNYYSKKWYVPIKMMASTCFLVFLIISLLIKDGKIGNEDYFLFVAFVFCFFGDLFMGQYNQRANKGYLVLGASLFCLGHVGLLVFMYFLHTYFNIAFVIIPIVAAALSALIMYFCKMKLGRLRIPGILYSLFVGSMLAKSIVDAVVFQDISSILMGIGGILFYISDFIILFLYFYKFKRKRNKKICHAFNLVTYYYAMFSFVICALCKI